MISVLDDRGGNENIPGTYSGDGRITRAQCVPIRRSSSGTGGLLQCSLHLGAVGGLKL